MRNRRRLQAQSGKLPIKREREESGDSALFFDIPLLFETGTEGNYDSVWVITAPYEVRKARVIERDGISPGIIDLIMDSQEDEEYKASRADIVFNNDGSLGDLKASVDAALKNL